MKPVNFDYERPRTIDEACELLASNSSAHFSWWPVIDTNVIDAPFETISSD